MLQSMCSTARTARCCAGSTASSSGRCAVPTIAIRRCQPGVPSLQPLRSHLVQASRVQPSRHLVCRADSDPSGSGKPSAGGGGFAVGDLFSRFKFNSIYLIIFGIFGALFLLPQAPYVFAGLTILTIIPQNSSNASLNSLVLLAYESGIFMNFAEAVDCVRLVTWLSIVCTLISFAVKG